MNNTINKPETGFAGLKKYWNTDIIAGFSVFLLAMPLSLGIAKASGFPPAMGLLTAMIGGLVVSMFKVSELTIKGPAAGLITICAGAVADFGGDEKGWHYACATIVVMGIIQFILSFLKIGRFSSFFPLSAVHGMLAAIGLIIIAKQIPILLGVDPALAKGLAPLVLYSKVPFFFANLNPTIALIGGISLAIMFGLYFFPIEKIKKIPAPTFVLLVAIPLAMFLNFKGTQPGYALVKIGNFWKEVSINADFSRIGEVAFWKYVLIFLFVNSLESILTVKAIDGRDPYKRKTDYDQDLRGLAVGNALSGLLGGLPMISEVARSMANKNNGAITKWSNFFHGGFLLLAMLLLIPVIEMIPNAALASMLIVVGYNLANPKEFIHSWKIGIDQFLVFIVTIAVTLLEDLLLGIAAGVLVSFIFQIIHKVPFGSFFAAKTEQNDTENKTHELVIKGGATFSNYVGIKESLEKLPTSETVVLDVQQCQYIDHTVLENFHNFQEEYNENGGKLTIVGLDKFRSLSSHPLSGKVLI